MRQSLEYQQRGCDPLVVSLQSQEFLWLCWITGCFKLSQAHLSVDRFGKGSCDYRESFKTEVKELAFFTEMQCQSPLELFQQGRWFGILLLQRCEGRWLNQSFPTVCQKKWSGVREGDAFGKLRLVLLLGLGMLTSTESYCSSWLLLWW